MSPRIACWSLASLLALGVGAAHATTISIAIADGPGEGFNDAAPRDPVRGNPGTTLGEQRLNVFRAAADYWETRLDSDVEIVVSASFDPQFCASDRAMLGGARTTSVHRDFPDAPLANTWYHAALADALSGSDLNGADPEIVTSFNGALDEGNQDCFGGRSWDYRLGSTGNQLQFYATLLHELAHGLGISSFADAASGRKLLGFDDVYLTNLIDASTGKAWSAMSDAERRASATNTGALAWSGARTVREAEFLDAGRVGGLVRMYAPNPVETGSSVSHFDVALSPDELMEPFATPFPEDWLTTKAFYDIGWPGNPCLETGLSVGAWTMLSLDCVPPAGRDTVRALFDDRLPGDYADDWVVYAYDTEPGAAGGSYRLLDEDESLEPGRGYWILSGAPGTAALELPRYSNRTPSPVTAAAGCVAGRTCAERALATAPLRVQFSMVGNPYRRPVALSDVRIVTEAGACTSGCTLGQAETNGVALSVAYGYDAALREYRTLGEGDALAARSGAWMATMDTADGLNPRVLFPR